MFNIAFASIGFYEGKFYARVSFKLSGICHGLPYRPLAHIEHNPLSFL